MLYTVILLLLIFLSYYYDYGQKTNGKNLWYNVILVILILVAGLRYRLGIDTIAYEQSFIYDAIPLSRVNFLDLFNYHWEPFFFLLESLARTISSEFWVLQLLQAVIVNVVFFRFFKKNTKNIFLAVLIYFITLYFSYNMETMRESCAVAMFLLGYEYYKKNNIFVFCLYLLTAFLFHNSAILLFIIPVIRVLKIDRFFAINKSTIFILLGVAAAGFAIQKIFFIQLNMIAITDRMVDKVVAYENSSYAGQTFNINGIIGVVLYKIILPLIAVCSLKASHDSKVKDIELFVYFQFIVAILSVPIVLFYRYDNYFMPFSYIAISNFFYQNRTAISNKSVIRIRSFAMWIIVILSPIWIVRAQQVFIGKEGNTGIKAFSRYYPYNSVLTEGTDAEREALYNYKGR